VAGMRRADELRAVRGEHLAEGVRGKGPVGGGNAVEPGLADAVPVGLARHAAVDHAEAQAAKPGELPDDLGMRTRTVGEELLASEAVLAADEADAPDHALWFRQVGFGC